MVEPPPDEPVTPADGPAAIVTETPEASASKSKVKGKKGTSKSKKTKVTEPKDDALGTEALATSMALAVIEEGAEAEEVVGQSESEILRL